MRFGIITDTHYGPDQYINNELRILSSKSDEVMRRIVSKMNELPDLEFVIHLGDLIQDDMDKPSQEEDLENMRRVRAILSSLNVPTYYVLGNHDFPNVPIADCCQQLNLENPYYSFTAGSYDCFVLFSECPAKGVIEFPEKELIWLEDQLAATSNEALVFIHHALADYPTEGTYWWDKDPNSCLIKNRKQVRELIHNSNKVRGVFSGHVHNSHLCVEDSMPYFFTGSCVEDLEMDGRPSETFAIVEVSSECVVSKISGMDRVELKF